MRAMVVVLVGCAASDHVDPFPAGTEVAASAALIDATSRSDVAAVQKLLQAPIGYGGLVFRDADCNQRFATAGTIEAADVQAFALCLATLHFALSPHRTHELPDTALLVYDPGIEVEARFDERGDHPLRWIGFVARENLKDALPTIPPDVLAAHKLTGDPPLPAFRAELDRARAAHRRVVIEDWFKLCIDAEGRVTELRARQVTSVESARLVASVLQKWTFRPFELDGNPIPVCSFVAFQYPPRQQEQLPVPPPPDTAAAVVVGRNVLKRIAGETQIVPDDADRRALDRSETERVTAVLLYCIDETGRVTTGYIARPSGLPRYDGRLAAAAKNWRFQPFVADGVAIPVCSTVVFIYTQHNRPHFPVLRSR